ncbi:MAG: hypothetical protein KAR08_10280 [Candidatus Heimdallarchaeota archaeon]|nr:hypothetical protein [Candidatus Heimdallarchaeota archaeon]
MATQNKKKILGLGFRFYEPKLKLKENHNEQHRRNSHIKHKNVRKSRIRANYNSMFYGY